MQSRRNVGPDLDWLRQERERTNRGRSDDFPPRRRSRSPGKGRCGCGKGEGKQPFGDTSNDWHCCDCDARNFARRTECFKCGLRRGDDVDDDRPAGGGGLTGKGGSRELFQQRSRSQSNSGSRRSNSGSRSGSRSRSRSNRTPSAEKPPPKKLRQPGGLWDSMQQTEAKPQNARPRPKKHGLYVDIGKRVDIFGLKGAAQYNGCEGRVSAGPNEKARFLVHLVYQGDVKELALLEDNLRAKPTCGWEVVAAGLPMNVTEEDISLVFCKIGVVQHVKVTRDQNGLSKGVALIVMAHREAAERALGMPEVEICGIGVKLQWSTMVKQEMGLLKTRDDEKGTSDLGSQRKFNESGGFSDGQTAPDAVEEPVIQPPQQDANKPVTFVPGQAVLVSGLKSAPQFNGIIGHVNSVRPDGRCEVVLQLETECKMLALKAENLSDAGAGGAAPATNSSPAQSKTATPTDAPREEPKPPSSSSAPQPAPGADAAQPQQGQSEDGNGVRKRRRKSAWDAENQGGEVYVRDPKKNWAPAPPLSTPAPVEPIPECPPEPVPPEEELGAMSAKELKRLLASHSVDVTGCVEKCDYLEKARRLAQTS